METLEIEANGLRADIPVLPGQSTIDDLLGGFDAGPGPALPAGAAGTAGNRTAVSQPALF